MNFGKAIEALKNGQKVARRGWNGKGMHLVLIHGKSLHNAITENYGDGIPENTPEANVVDLISNGELRQTGMYSVASGIGMFGDFMYISAQ